MSAKTETLTTSIDAYAQEWQVSAKVVETWTEVVFQAFDVQLPKRGPFTAEAVLLLNEVAKHVGTMASQFFAETGEKRRLKYVEFVEKARTSRTYQQHLQKFLRTSDTRSSETSVQRVGGGAEDEIYGELALLSRESDDETDRIKQSIEAWEDTQVEELADFIEDSPNRRMNKLAAALSRRRAQRQQESLERATRTVFR